MIKNPTPWRVWTGKLRPQFPTYIIEIVDANDQTVLPWKTFDGMKKTAANNLAKKIVNAVNETSS